MDHKKICHCGYWLKYIGEKTRKGNITGMRDVKSIRNFLQCVPALRFLRCEVASPFCIYLFIRSLISTLKSIGPKWDPRETPDREIKEFEQKPITNTLECWYDKYDLTHLSNNPWMPDSDKFFKIIWWSTLSNALLKSVNMASTVIRLINNAKFVIVDLDSMKSCWCVVIICLDA